MKRALVIGEPCLTVNALQEGFQRIGYACTRLGEENPYPDPDSHFKHDIAVMRGMKTPAKFRTAMNFWSVGKPTAMLECGYFKRSGGRHIDGYSQLNVCGLNQLPHPDDCDSARWDALGLPIYPTQAAGDFSDTCPILMAGQVPDDTQHRMSQVELRDWYVRMRNLCLEKWDFPVLYREHPEAVARGMAVNDGSLPAAQVLIDRPIEEALPYYSALVTLNSTTGLEAIRLGMPVICHQKSMYYGAATSYPWGSKLIGADEATRTKLLHRVAYAQWSVQELLSGEPQESWESQATRWQLGDPLTDMWQDLFQRHAPQHSH